MNTVTRKRRAVNRLATLAIISLATTLSSPAAYATTEKTSSVKTITQLPRTVHPNNYALVLQPDVENLSFYGKVEIDIDVLKPTNSITLNAAELTIEKVFLINRETRTSLVPSKVQLNADQQTATFSFTKTILPTDYILSIEYNGKIGSQASGLFAIDYDTTEGHKRALYSQFENSYARRFIPSWDEPAYKATFQLEATVPNGLIAISNMPISTTTAANGLSRVRFKPTPKMSTYLLFFALGEFERSTAQTGDTEVGVVVKKGSSDQASFVLKSTQDVLQEYNQYFGTPYPLPKLDNVAAPGRSQFFSAMENWGAIFTFEHSILLDPAISSQADKQRAFTIAAHETAHQWFGNLVTMAWWDDLWLNESFASWMESRTTSRLHPEWHSQLSAIGVRERAMDLDALATTHPVVQPVKTVDQVNQAFDAITYQKGQSVIRMLEAYVGEDAWRTGIQHYMQRYHYGNTVSSDLWRELEAVAGKPIAAIAHDFTQQPGIPLIRVESTECKQGVTEVKLRQTEFSKDSPNKKPGLWQVPVQIKTLSDIAIPPVHTLVSNHVAKVSVPGCYPLLVNAGQNGYFRTLYTANQLSELVQNFAKLPAIDQLGILADVSALGLAGQQSASDVLDLIKAVPIDADPQVWDQVAYILRSLDDYYRDDKLRGDKTHRDQFRTFAIASLSRVFKKIGWQAQANEADAVAILRNDLITSLGSFAAEDVINEARRRLAEQNTDPTAVPPSLRKAILGVVARHADSVAWEQLHATAQTETTPLIKDLLYTLLSSSEDESLTKRALELSLSAEPGSTNSGAMILASSKLHPDLAFDFAIEHFPQVIEKVDPPSRTRFFAWLAERSFDPEMVEKLNRYANANLANNARRSVNTSIATIHYRRKVRNEQLPQIEQWLKKNAPN